MNLVEKIVLFLLLLAALALTPRSNADPATLVHVLTRLEVDKHPELYARSYDSADDAAVAALRDAYARSPYYEYGGWIFKTPEGEYRAQVAHTRYSGDGIFLGSNENTYGYEAVADYHTHPCLPYSHFPAYFSDNDVGSNAATSTDGYLGDLCSGYITRYRLGITPKNYCWATDECGSRGEALDERISITHRPVVLEIPSPTQLRRGMNTW